MVTLLLDSDRLEVVLSRAERTLARHSGNVVVSRADIVRATVTQDAWIWLRGVPSPGTYVPAVIAMGSWRSGAGLDFALVRRRRPGVVIDLDGHDRFERLVLTTRHGAELLTALSLEASDSLVDVVDIAADVD